MAVPVQHKHLKFFISDFNTLDFFGVQFQTYILQLFAFHSILAENFIIIVNCIMTNNSVSVCTSEASSSSCWSTLRHE